MNRKLSVYTPLYCGLPIFSKQFKLRKGEFEREENAKYYLNVLNFIVKVIFY
jgi:hypothetical protein